jgi:hypothetical protein
MWIQTLLWEIGIKSPQHTIMWCDNIGAKYLSTNPTFHGCMKHVEVDCHFVRERAARKLLHIDFVPSGDGSSCRWIHKTFGHSTTEKFEAQSYLAKL